MANKIEWAFLDSGCKESTLRIDRFMRGADKASIIWAMPHQRSDLTFVLLQASRSKPPMTARSGCLVLTEAGCRCNASTRPRIAPIFQVALGLDAAACVEERAYWGCKRLSTAART